jgi:hypothetical protein
MKARRPIAAPKAQGLCGPCCGLVVITAGILRAVEWGRTVISWQQSLRPNVGYGSLADIAASGVNEYTP